MADDEIGTSKHDPTQHQLVVSPQVRLFDLREAISGARQNPDTENDREDRAADQACGNPQSLRMDVHDVLAG